MALKWSPAIKKLKKKNSKEKTMWYATQFIFLKLINFQAMQEIAHPCIKRNEDLNNIHVLN